jgi:hypothetical protein
MSDLAEQILAHLDKIETDARNARDNHIVLSLPKMAGKTTAKAHLDNWTPDAVLRYCAADREIVEIAKYHIENLKIHRVNGAPILTTDEATAALMTRMLQVLARGYGIQP